MTTLDSSKKTMVLGMGDDDDDQDGVLLGDLKWTSDEQPEGHLKRKNNNLIVVQYTLI